MKKSTRTLSATEKLTLLAQTGLPILVQGMPGEAQPAYIDALALATNRSLKRRTLFPCEASDICNTDIESNPPAWAKQLVAAKDQGSILVFEELSYMSPLVQCALLKIVLGKRVGLDLPNTWVIVSVVTNENMDIATGVSSHFIHLSWDTDIASWVEGMINGFQPKVVPADWTDRIADASALIRCFIEESPEHLPHDGI